MSERDVDNLFSEVSEDDACAIDGSDVLLIVSGLIQIVLSFVPAVQAKSMIDKAWAQMVNEAADKRENEMFDTSKN